MKTLREQVLIRIKALGGESSEFYNDYSDYDLLEDYESALRLEIEEEYAAISKKEAETDD